MEIKCRKCGTPIKDRPLKSWILKGKIPKDNPRTFKVLLFECPKCGATTRKLIPL